jgi:hypothetical protein
VREGGCREYGLITGRAVTGGQLESCGGLPGILESSRPYRTELDWIRLDHHGAIIRPRRARGNEPIGQSSFNSLNAVALPPDYDENPGRFRLARAVRDRHLASRDSTRASRRGCWMDGLTPVLDVGCWRQGQGRKRMSGGSGSCETLRDFTLEIGAPAGAHELFLAFPTGGMDVDQIRFNGPGITAPPPPEVEATATPA